MDHAMDHAEAHERIADLVLDRDSLARLPGDGSPSARGNAVDEAAFLAHVQGCPACRADLAAIRTLDARLRDALGDVRDVAAIQPIHAPAALRNAVLEAARREPRVEPRPRPATVPEAAAGPPGRWRIGRWSLSLPRLTSGQWAAGIAAVLVVAVAAGIVGGSLAPAGRTPDPSMVAVMGTLDRVLAAPDHHLATLTTTAGAASGSVAWTSLDFVVLTSALAEPAPGHVYRCWLEWAGRSAPVGVMDFVGPTAFWTGATGDWSKLLGDPGTRFVVTAEPSGPAGPAPSGSVVLQATLGT